MIDQRVKAILASVLGVKSNEITDKTSQKDTKEWDSMAHINLVVALEDEFGVNFSDEQIVGLLSYDLIIETMRNLNEKI